MPERINPEDRQEWLRFGWEHIQRYSFAASRCPSGTGLDYGCGIGYGVEILNQCDSIPIVGVDSDLSIVEKAKKRLVSESVVFYSSLEEACMAHPQAFDFVVMFEVIEHVQDPTQSLSQIAACIKDGGILFISAPNRLQFGSAAVPVANPWHNNEPDYDDLHRWLKKEFEVIGEYEQSVILPPGYQDLAAISSQSVLIRAERALRKLAGRPFKQPADLVSTMQDWTKIFPLISERRHLAQHFIFIAKRKSSLNRCS